MYAALAHISELKCVPLKPFLLRTFLRNRVLIDNVPHISFQMAFLQASNHSFGFISQCRAGILQLLHDMEQDGKSSKGKYLKFLKEVSAIAGESRGQIFERTVSLLLRVKS